MKESEKDSMAKKDRRARQTNGQKWTKENGNKWASKTCKSNGRQRRTKGTGVKVVTRDRDREEASSKVVLRKLAIWDVISEIARVYLFPRVFLSLFRRNALFRVDKHIIDIDEPNEPTMNDATKIAALSQREK